MNHINDSGASNLYPEAEKRLNNQKCCFQFACYSGNAVHCHKLLTLCTMMISLASYPGLTQFFNVARSETGRPGRSGDVIGHYFGRGLESPPIRPRARDHMRRKVFMVQAHAWANGRMGGDSKPRPKQRPITSPDRPGLPLFQRATLQNWVRPGYEARFLFQTLS